MKKLSAAFAGLLLASQIFAQTEHDSITKKIWEALWITVPDAPLRDYGVYHFRKSFQMNEKPSQFVIHVSADNRYKLFVNGKLASLGPATGDIYNWNFETVDIAPFLQTGNNTLAAVVWNFGDERQEAQISWFTAFILQGNSANEQIVNTNNTWKCVRDSAYSPVQPELLYTYYAVGPTERVDFNRYPSGWEQTSYDDNNWKPALQLFNGLPKGVFNWTLGWMLVARPIPQMELTPQRLQAIRIANNIEVSNEFLQGGKTFIVPAGKSISLLIDQSYLTTAFPVLQFSKGKNAVISLSYAEGLYIDEGDKKDWREQNQKGNRNEVEGKRFVGTKDILVSNGSDSQTFTSLNWRTYRYIKLDIETKDEALTINDLYGIFDGYPFEWNAAFESDDTTLSKILETGWRTARLDAHETYMDCPYYEQLQYVGDTRIQALVSLYNSGDDRLARNAIQQIRNSLMPEGITMSRFPTAHAQQIPTFSLIWIGMLHDYYMYRGDENFIRRQLPVARMVLQFFQQYQQEDGSLKNSPYWNFTDWVEDSGWAGGVGPKSLDGTSAMLDLQLLMAYQTAASLEQQLGMKAFADIYSNNAAHLKQAIQKNYWSESRNMFSDTKEKGLFSQHTNTLAILTKVIAGDDAKALMEKIITDTVISKASVYFRYYLHRALAKTGLGSRYLDMLGKWRENLAMGLTTWAEMDDVSRSRSDCHAWGSSPNIELFRIVLGIDTDGPGFSKVKVEPHPGYLKNVSGAMPHPKGKIAVHYAEGTNGKWNCSVQLPSTVTGTFVWNGKTYELKEGDNKFSF